MSKPSHKSAFDSSDETARPAGVELVPIAAPPGRALRHDGWTPEKQAIYLEALATDHNVSRAAKAAGMSRAAAYKLRARLKGEPFDLAWDAAFQCSFDALGAAAMDRALNGVERHHYYKGELVGTSRKFDERLTIALLAMRHSFLRDEPPRTDPSAAYDAEDFRGLLARVKDGPETWDGYDEEDIGEDDEGDWEDG